MNNYDLTMRKIAMLVFNTSYGSSIGFNVAT